MPDLSMYLVRCDDELLGEVYQLCSASSAEDAIQHFWDGCEVSTSHKHISVDTHQYSVAVVPIVFCTPFQFVKSVAR